MTETLPDVDADVVVQVGRDDELHVVELTDLEAKAAALQLETGRNNVDVQPTRDEQIDDLSSGLMGCDL